MNINRKWMAFIFAPMLPSLFFLYAMGGEVKTTVLILVFSIPFSYLPSVMAGLPVIYFLDKLKRLSVLNVAIVGALLGGIVFDTFIVVFSKMLGSDAVPALDWGSWMFGALSGLIVATAVGLIAGFPFINEFKSSKKKSDLQD